MMPVSVVIISHNEAEFIGNTIKAAKFITDDIVVIDSGSTDETMQIALNLGCRVFRKNWEGYGFAKNAGINHAKYDWILSLDADEIPDKELLYELKILKFTDIQTVYDLRFKTYLGKNLVKFGNWGNDHHVRLFNRTRYRWSYSPVHETLSIGKNTKTEQLKGYVHHYSAKSIEEFDSKSATYARLCAMKYLEEGKTPRFTDMYLSAIFNFIKFYIFYLGILDGKTGLRIAMVTFNYTYSKYALLQKLHAEKYNLKNFKNIQIATQY